MATASTGRVAHVHAQSHARIHVPNDRERVLRSREVLVLGSVIVNGDGDVVLLDEALDAGEGGTSGSDDHEGHPARLGVLEVSPNVVVVVFLEVDGAAPHDLEPGLLELSTSRLQLVSGRLVRQMERLDVDARHAQGPDGGDGVAPG
jgi:hypothetical protein